MEALHTLIGPDCMDIILDYKKEFERIENNYKQIDDCIFEEFNTAKFEEIFDKQNYVTESEKLERRYSLEDFSIKEFINYYEDEKCFMSITIKITIQGLSMHDFADDYVPLKIKNIKTNYMKKQKIKYIYKTNNFDLCLYLGIYKEYQLGTLYENIALEYITDNHQIVN